MAYISRPTSLYPPGSGVASSIRPPNSHHNMSQQQSSALAARITLKKAELENLRQLRDMSGTLAVQMQALEQKIGTLKDGTEAVACVLANWDNVLRAISMASSAAKLTSIGRPTEQDPVLGGDVMNKSHMPATMVRIPAEKEMSGGSE
ncbi:DASH complex subunit Dad2-domain-containing protein [Aspergillus avenaceus]|uniref:DASH complex subunit DAD2 n=1 Tax=Aspergillus avenaceus TaxID=36643 RepID=A0A5N6TL58_ASPAV|nr:DASH complex subunit Dad2-domain-containing protein [Aspergillus avenaceus]